MYEKSKRELFPQILNGLYLIKTYLPFNFFYFSVILSFLNILYKNMFLKPSSKHS